MAKADLPTLKVLLCFPPLHPPPPPQVRLPIAGSSSGYAESVNSGPRPNLELGDGWWELGERDKAYRKALHMRAAHWYAQAVKTLPSGLFRVKAEMRVQQVKREYGQDVAGSAISGHDG